MFNYKIVLIVASVAALVAGACSPGPAGPGKPAAPAPGTSPAPGGPQGWQERWDTILAAAQKEGKVVAYGDMGVEARDAVAAKFREKYGIILDLVAGRSNEVTQKYITETRAGLYIADYFIIGGGSSINILKPGGYLAPISSMLFVPQVTDPKAWPEGKIPYLDKDGMMLPLVAPYTSYSVVNTDLVKEGQIKSYRDFLKPEWKGKITFFDPTSSGAAAGWVTFIIYNVFGKAEGERYIRDFARQEPAMTRDVRTHIEWVARGRYALGVGAQYNSVANFMAMGAPIRMLRLEEGGQLNPGGGILTYVARPANPNAAVILAHWLLSAEGQAIFSQAWKAPPVRLGVGTAGMDPSLFAQPGDKVFWSDEESFVNQGKTWELSREVFGPLMK